MNVKTNFKRSYTVRLSKVFNWSAGCELHQLL